MKGYAAALALGSASLLGACTTPPATDPPNSTSTSGSSGTSATSTSPPSTTATPQTTSDSSSPSLPPSATENSAAGAQAFVDFYLKSLNEALKTADPERIRGLTEPTCKTCATWLTRTEALRNDGRHLVADLYTPTLITASEFGKDTSSVQVQGEQKGTSVVNREGNKVDDVPRLEQ